MVFAVFCIKAITSTMDFISVPESEDSENSIVEVELPKKPTPPLIVLEEEERILNVKSDNRQTFLAKDFVRNDIMLGNESSNTQLDLKNAQSLSNPPHWTKDMIKFYNDDWGGEEEFIVDKIQARMSKAPSLWQISRKDYLYMKKKRPRYNIRCYNCLRYGHRLLDCPEPRYVPICHMCGSKGHFGDFCPSSKCLNCGSPTKNYLISCGKCKNQLKQKCSRCNLVGHSFNDCSDHWRLFHLTTNSLSVVVPDKNVHKSEKDLWCCNCGFQGHCQTSCLEVKNIEYGDTLRFVVSYENSFQFNKVEVKRHRNKLSGKFKQKFKERKKKEHQIEKIKRINKQNRMIKNNKFNLSHHNFKKLYKFKNYERNRCN